MTENELKKELCRSLESDFEIKAEVAGNFIVDGSKVVIDYLLFPKEHLINKGFKPSWFGVEVKSPNGEGAKKAIRLAWQAITYSQSKFEGERPDFVLVYPPLSEFFKKPQDAYYLVCMLQKANVGYIELRPEKKKWKIKFGANLHFSSDRGSSNTPNAGIKRHVGTWK
jgi:hypothetical protein